MAVGTLYHKWEHQQMTFSQIPWLFLFPLACHISPFCPEAFCSYLFWKLTSGSPCPAHFLYVYTVFFILLPGYCMLSVCIGNVLLHIRKAMITNVSCHTYKTILNLAKKRADHTSISSFDPLWLS